MKDHPVFGSFGRFQETPKAEMPPDMKTAFDFTMRLPGEVPGPHKIWICNPKLSETIVPTGAYYQTKSMWEKEGQKHYTTEVVLRLFNSALRMQTGPSPIRDAPGPPLLTVRVETSAQPSSPAR